MPASSESIGVDEKKKKQKKQTNNKKKTLFCFDNSLFSIELKNSSVDENLKLQIAHIH